ncbi:ogr/Delta-like zinc finger family protein [Pseudomonas sp. PCH199]|uniref:ogr/Delta-like zinc finger family protein n=1 Tax=unclassified Pseudomonas TaxID=196821 RepID=UPI000BD67401|nr:MULTISPECIES: ogr/Delta-like zinc finger family protein [unclassified Pseudomonas]MCW8275550.1 ogr/Delta-like zinc finger family protein [Pseudomonas sp. PCH199]PAM84425.1 transcriptional regulator [Pseudomonas sp. ERMR1:02]
MRVTCRDCEGKALISEVEELSSESKKLYCLCLSPRCGHSFVMDLAFSHTLNPSAKKLDISLLERFRELSSAQQLNLLDKLDEFR